MQRFHVDGWRGRVRSRLRAEHPGSPLQELSLPGRDLVGMNVKLLRQFGQRLLTPYGSQGHLRFESRRGVPAWSSAHRFSCSAAILAAVRQKLHLSNLFKNPEPALSRCDHPRALSVFDQGTPRLFKRLKGALARNGLNQLVQVPWTR